MSITQSTSMDVSQYIIAIEFPYHDYVSKYKDKLISNYTTLKQQHPDLTDIPVEINELNDTILPAIDKLVNHQFWVGDPISNSSMYVYIQNNEIFESRYHNHVHIGGTINAVFYIDPPQEGGEIEFIYDIQNNNSLKIQPQPNVIYFFPNWLYHRPLPQKDKHYRLCFNYRHNSNVRPIHKLSGIQY
tara:strand:+ start:1845 stop:2405 length:561 start_codon:yes stop_codon:yes gene_type:complete